MNEQTKSQTAVGQYYLMEKIAQGGMAEIFKGLSYDVHGLKRTVCIKKMAFVMTEGVFVYDRWLLYCNG